MQPWSRKIPEELKDLITYIDDSKDNTELNVIIYYIRKHPGMHFQTKNLTNEFITLILYSLYIDFEQLALEIFYKFKKLIDLSALVSSCFVELIDPKILEVFFKAYVDIISNSKFVHASMIYAGVLRKSQTFKNTDYWNIVKDNEIFLDAIGDSFYNSILQPYNISFYLHPETVKMVKYSFKFASVLTGFLSIAQKNKDFMMAYFPEANDIFIF